MNVGELKKMLDKYPDSMNVIRTICSDYEILEESEFELVCGVLRGDNYVMSSHRTMSQENKDKEQMFLHLNGL